MSPFLFPRKKRALLKILSYISTASLLLTFVILPMQPTAHADVVEFTEATNAAITAIEAYGQYNGTSLAYEVLENESAVETAGELITGLWSEYSAQASDPITLAALGAFAITAGAVTWYTGTDGFQHAQLYLEDEITEQLDGFWNWVTGRAGWVRDSEGVLHPPNDFIDFSVYEALTMVNNPIEAWSLPSFHYIGAEGLYSGENDHWPYPFTIITGDYVYGVWLSYNGTLGPNANTRFAVLASGDSGCAVNYSMNGQNLLLTTSYTYEGKTVYYAGVTMSAYTFNQPCFPYLGIPHSDLNRAAWAMVYGGGIQPSIEVVQPVGPVILPDTSDPDYVPRPVTIETNIPVPSRFTDPSDPLYDPDPLPADIANALMPIGAQQVVEDTLEVSQPQVDPDPVPDPEPGPSPDAPVEVVTPLLPVSFPSFNFSLSGIWHYVVEWVGTLGSWFSMVFTIWSHLPYAFVVPVYATAVVVIVLGVYKRFFM